MEDYKKKNKVWQDKMVLKGKLELISINRLKKFENDLNAELEFVNDGLIESFMYNL